MENNTIYIVKAFYDLNVDTDEEILIEPYATEELARARCKQLIENYKRYNLEREADNQDWDETDTYLYAYDDKWNVEICYDVDVLRTKLERDD